MLCLGGKEDERCTGLRVYYFVEWFQSPSFYFCDKLLFFLTFSKKLWEIQILLQNTKYVFESIFLHFYDSYCYALVWIFVVCVCLFLTGFLWLCFSRWNSARGKVLIPPNKENSIPSKIPLCFWTTESCEFMIRKEKWLIYVFIYSFDGMTQIEFFLSFWLTFKNMQKLLRVGTIKCENFVVKRWKQTWMNLLSIFREINVVFVKKTFVLVPPFFNSCFN